MTPPDAKARSAVHPLAAVTSSDPVKRARPDPLPLVFAPELAKPLAPLRWLSKSFALIQGRVLAFTGYGDAGKTFAAMDLALAVASSAAKALGGLDVGLAGPVVHLDYEQQLWITQWRYQRLAHARRVDLTGLADRLGVVSLPHLRLNSPGAERELVRVLEGKALAVIDNLTAACPGVDQNTTAIADPLYMLGQVSAATGCTVIVIHHDNKTPADGHGGRPRSQQMRGSGAIHAAIGGGLAFTKQESGIIKYESIKETMGAKPTPESFKIVDVGDIDPNTERTIGLELEWVPVEQAAQAWGARGSEPKFSALVKRVVERVKERPGKAVASAMAAEWGVRKGDVVGAFDEAQAEGLIKNLGTARNAPKWHPV